MYIIDVWRFLLYYAIPQFLVDAFSESYHLIQFRCYLLWVSEDTEMQITLG